MKNNCFILLFVVISACQKTDISSINPGDVYQKNIKRDLLDSLGRSSFQSLDFLNIKTSRAASNRFLARIPFKDNSNTNRFALVITDSIGHVSSGKVCDLDLRISKRDSSKLLVNGRAKIHNLTTKDAPFKTIVNGRFVRPVTRAVTNPDDEDQLPDFGEPPIDGGSLPEFVVVSNAMSTDIWVWVPEMTDCFSSPNVYIATYLQVDPPTDPNKEISMQVEFDKGEDPPVQLQKLLDCFSTILSSGAKYSIKLCADVPSNTFPMAAINSTLSPGHTFLILTKSNGGQSVTQVFGYYPGGSSTKTSIHDNSYREIMSALKCH